MHTYRAAQHGAVKHHANVPRVVAGASVGMPGVSVAFVFGLPGGVRAVVLVLVVLAGAVGRTHAPPVHILVVVLVAVAVSGVIGLVVVVAVAAVPVIKVAEANVAVVVVAVVAAAAVIVVTVTVVVVVGGVGGDGAAVTRVCVDFAVATVTVMVVTVIVVTAAATVVVGRAKHVYPFPVSWLQVPFRVADCGQLLFSQSAHFIPLLAPLQVVPAT